MNVGHLEQAEEKENECKERIKALLMMQEKEAEEYSHIAQAKEKSINKECVKLLEMLLGESAEERINEEKE